MGALFLIARQMATRSPLPRRKPAIVDAARPPSLGAHGYP